MLLVISEGKRIWGMIQFDEGLPKKMQNELQQLNFRRSILKPPIKNIISDHSLNNF